MMKTLKSSSDRNIIKIESLIKETIVLDDMMLYKYCNDSDTLDIINYDSVEPLTLEDSFLKYTIESKEIEFDNHIKSNRHYSSEFDNPKDFVVRGLMMYPLVIKEKTVGILSIYRSAKSGVNFTRKDKKALKELEPILLKAINKESIEDKDILALKEKSPEPKVDKIFKEPLAKKSKKVKNSDIQELEYKLKEEQKEKKELEKILKEYMLKEIDDSKKIKKLSKDMIKLEKELDELKQNKQIQDKNISIMQDEVSSKRELEEKNKELKADIKERNSIIKKYDKNKIKAEFNQNKLASNFDYIQDNIEFLLKEVAPKFDGKQSAYSMFEMMVYAISSHKGMDIIDDFISQSKGLGRFLNIFYNSVDIKANREKYQVKKIFDYNIKDNIIFDESLPISLIIDTPKISSILYHMKENLSQNRADKNLINFDISYDKQLLSIGLNGRIKTDDGLLNNPNC